MERIAADDTPLTHVDPAELQRELEQRLAARKDGARSPQDNPRARMAGASPVELWEITDVAERSVPQVDLSMNRPAK